VFVVFSLRLRVRLHVDVARGDDVVVSVVGAVRHRALLAAGHVVGDVVDLLGGVVGRVARQQTPERLPEVGILPGVYHRVHSRIADGHRERDLVKQVELAAGVGDPEVGGHDEVRHPTDGEATQGQHYHLKEKKSILKKSFARNNLHVNGKMLSLISLSTSF
jgi:hypothetical protein